MRISDWSSDVCSSDLPVARPSAPRPIRSGNATPLRSAAILTMVAGLIATVALPAYAAWHPEEQTQTLPQMSANAQKSLVLASDASAVQLQRSIIAATTPAGSKKTQDTAAPHDPARQPDD